MPILLEQSMVQISEERLAEQDEEERDADDGVRLVDFMKFCRQVDSQAEGDKVYELPDDLEDGMDPDQALEVRDANQNAANGEETNECEACEDCMDFQEM